MADIYLVLASTEAGVDRYLVLKRVLAERARDPVFAQMFLDEARLAAQLQHPNIAQVYDVGKLDGSYFFTMEYVHGEDIRGVLRKCSQLKKPLPVNLALFVASSTLSALEHAHQRTTPDGKPLNIVHRDVTPSNVMISYEGAVKLLDFGVAKANERATESRTGSIKGKIAYLSPEQVRADGRLDRRSDIYSLGIVLWEMLTRKRLYKRDSDFNTMLAITTEETPRPSTLRPELSPEIDRIVMTALEKDRDKRYPSAGAMLEDIEAVATAERHSLSGTAMGRFMREAFGTKPPPWVELKPPDDTAKPITITSEKAGTGSLGTKYEGPVDEYRGPLGPQDLDALKTQLERARDLRPAMDPMRLSGSLDEYPSATPLPGSLAAVHPEAPVRRSKLGVLLLTMLATVGIAGGAYYMLVVRDSSNAPDSRTQSVLAAPPAPTATPPAPVAEMPSTPVAPEPTIATASDAETILRLCIVSDTKTLSADDRKRCGVAACELDQRATAVGYRDASEPGGRREIEAACRDKGIVLVADKPPAHPPARPTKRVQPTTPKQTDPCKNPAFVEAHPLQCP